MPIVAGLWIAVVLPLLLFGSCVKACEDKPKETPAAGNNANDNEQGDT